MPFTPAGQTQPNDTLVGGGGDDTLVLKAETGTGTAGPNVTADAIAAPTPSAHATTLTVSNGLAVAADLPTDGSGLVIQIGSEQMLVTAVNGNVLTVERGYNGTTAAAHGNNALVILPVTGSPEATTSDYALYLNQAGAADQYAATLSTLRFGTIAAGSTTVTGIDNTAGLAVGLAVTGPGISDRHDDRGDCVIDVDYPVERGHAFAGQPTADVRHRRHDCRDTARRYQQH